MSRPLRTSLRQRMPSEVIPIYDTPEHDSGELNEQNGSQTTPDLLGQLLFDYIPKSQEWVSVPDEDDPAGEHWVPKWTNITDAVTEIERFLTSTEAQRMDVAGFSLEQLVDELQLFLDELRAASSHATRFHLCAY